MSKPVGDRLRDAASLFDQRNAVYGDNYKTMGPVLHAMYPQGLTVSTPGEWQRLFTIVMQATKITRYAQNINRGGHEDSLDDIAVYSIMAAHTDQLEREAGTPAASVTPAPHISSLVRRLSSLVVIAHGLTLAEAKSAWRQGCMVRRAAWGPGRFLDQYSALSLEDDTSFDWIVVRPETEAVDPPEAAVDDEWRSTAAAGRV